MTDIDCDDGNVVTLLDTSVEHTALNWATYSDVTAGGRHVRGVSDYVVVCPLFTLSSVHVL